MLIGELLTGAMAIVLLCLIVDLSQFERVSTNSDESDDENSSENCD